MSLRRSAVLLGVLNRLVLHRHLGQGRVRFHLGQGRVRFPKALEPPAGQERAATRVRASDSERGSRRARATRKQEDQRRRAGCRGERSKQRTPTYHRDSGTGLSRSSG
jgi:hypothetical protein